MKSYRPEGLFDEDGKLRPAIAALAPKGDRRMSANPHANGGLLMRELDLPDIADCTLCSISALSTRPAVSQWSYFLTASYDGKRNGLPTPADAPATTTTRACPVAADRLELFMGHSLRDVAARNRRVSRRKRSDQLA